MVDRKLINYSIGYLKNVTYSNLYLRLGINICKPATITALLTWKCNARCRMCGHWRKKDHDEMSTENWKRWLTEMKSWHKSAHVQFSGGEPFVRKDSIELFQHCSSIGLSYGVTTNLGITPPDRFEGFVRANPFNVNISMDGIKPETHDFSRGVEGLLLRVMDNIKLLRNEIVKQNKKIRIILKPTVMSINLSQLEDIVRYAKESGLEGVNFQPIFSFSGSESEKYWITDLEEVDKVSHRLVEMKREGYPILSADRDILGWKSYFKGATTDEIPRGKCLVGVRNFYISPTGKVYLCRNINLVVGNLREQSPSEIWYSEAAEKARNTILRCKKLCLTTCQTKRTAKELCSAFMKMAFSRN